MIWQDLVITIANILFSYALIPQVIYGFKDHKPTVLIQTAFLTALGLYAVAIAFLTLNLIFSAVVSLLTGTLWALLLIQSIIYKR